ncbi:MAG TPA: hypothetical protein VFJ24_06425 [Gaiellales bacterium]|nr:hypothetical protein [Gaiellales bacterium]
MKKKQASSRGSKPKVKDLPVRSSKAVRGGTVSNIMKASSDTQSSITQNLK